MLSVKGHYVVHKGGAEFSFQSLLLFLQAKLSDKSKQKFHPLRALFIMQRHLGIL